MFLQTLKKLIVLLILFSGSLWAQPPETINDSTRLNLLLKEFDKNLKIVKQLPKLRKEKDALLRALIEAEASSMRKDSLFNSYVRISDQMQLLFIEELESSNRIKRLGNSAVWTGITYFTIDIVGSDRIRDSPWTKMLISSGVFGVTYVFGAPYNFWEIKDPTGLLNLIGL